MTRIAPLAPGRGESRWLGACALAALAVALYPIVLPFLHEGFPFTHDGGHQVTYAYRLDRALHQGQFPVRWTEPVQPGRGQPLFNYYQVGFHYLVAAVHVAVPRLLTAVKVVNVLLWWGAAACMFMLCRRFGTIAAAAAAGVFGLAPYLIVDVFVRGALPELAAIAFAIASLWMLDRFLVNGSSRRLALLAILLAVTATCHLPALLVLAPLFGAHVLWLWIDKQTSGTRVAAAAGAAVAAVGIAAFYILPAMLERHFVQIERLTEGNLDYRGHFVPLVQHILFVVTYRWEFGSSVTDPANLMPLHISLAEWIAVGGALTVVVWNIARHPRSRSDLGLRVWLSVVVLALFMMSAVSSWLWAQLPALAFVQFPWKFMALVSIASAVLAALLVSALSRPFLQLLAMVFLVGLQVHFYHRQLGPGGYGEAALWDVDRPEWRRDALYRDWDFVEWALNPAGARDVPRISGRWSIVKGDATVEETVVLDHRRSLTVTTREGATIALHTPYFPGWVMRVDGQLTPVGGRAGDAYMEVNVPAGTHVVSAVFENTPVRSWANRISVLSVLLVAVVGLRRRTVG